MAQYGPQEWFYATGELAVDQRAAIFGPGDINEFAPIFADAGLTIPLDNPTTTDAFGMLTFYAEPGQYIIFVGPVGTGDSIMVNLGAPGGFVLSVNGEFPDGFGNVELDAADVGAQPLATIDAVGDLYVGDAPDSTARLGVGTDGQVLTADSGEALGMRWATPSGGGAVTSVNGQTGVVVLVAADVGADPAGSAAAAAAASQPLATIDAKGDLYAGTANNTTTRLPVGTDGQALRANSATGTGLEWDTLSAGDVGADPAGSAAAAAAASQPLATINAKGDLYAGTANDTTARQPVGTDGQVLTADSGQATGLIWATPASAPVTSVNGQTGVVVLTSADVGAQPIATIDAKGDLYAGTGADATTRLPVGTDGQTLRANSAMATGLEWDTLTAADVGADPAGSAAAAAAASQPLATIDAKGDLYVGTADNTTTRQAVGTNGQVLTANSATGTGLEWQTPTTAPVTSVNGQTGVVVLGASDVGAQPIATIDAKGDLYAGTGDNATSRLAVGTNGQVLTADSTQSTGLRWTAATDANAQSRLTIDAKGDLYAGTAADTTTRLPVGTDGFVLVADSSQSTGLDWKIRSSIGMYPRSTGYVGAGAINTTRSSKSSTLDTMFLSPFFLLVGATLSGLAFEVTANIATAVVRLGIYASDSAMLPTGAPLADYGTTAAATTGTKTAAVSTVLRPGLYWVAAVGQTAAPTLRFCAGQSPWVANATFPSGSGVGWNNGYAQTGVSGGLPSIGTIADSDVPLLGLKF